MDDGQPRFNAALFGIKATNNAAAQEFFTADSHHRQIGTVHDDAGSAIASSTRDLVKLEGGAWLDRLNAPAGRARGFALPVTGR